MTATVPEPGAQPSSKPGAADTARSPEKPSGARRVLQILGAVLVVVVLPVGLMEPLAGKLGASAMILGLLAGELTRGHELDWDPAEAWLVDALSRALLARQHKKNANANKPADAPTSRAGRR